MQLTKAFEQAACIVVLLATQDPQVPVTSEVIHQRLGGSQTYLRKIMRKLVVAKLVTSVSGNNGGFTLAKSPAKISVAAVIEAVEGTIHTYPNLGYIDAVFRDIAPVANAGNQIVNKVFARADQLWINELRHQYIADLIRQLLQVQTIPIVNWNDATEDKSAVLGTIIQRIRQDS